jgi:phenylacetate-CoA ligase
MDFVSCLKRDIKANWKGYYTRVLKRHIGPFARRRQWLSKTQFMSAEQLQQIQLNLLQKVVEHAYETVPFYRDYMKSRGFGPQAIQSLSDIKLFPVITKKDLKEAGDAFVSTKFQDRFMRTVHTGGTTGTPLPLRRDLRSIQHEHCFVRRQFDWAGVEMTDRCALMTWRRVAAPNEHDRLTLYDAGMRELHLSTIHLSEEVIVPYVQAMRRYKVRALQAYPSAAYFVAKGMLARGIRLPLKAVLTTSETLDPAKKEVIEQAFECKVFDYYGSAERVCYIHMCEKGSYHIVPEYGLTELVVADPPNDECCKIVATGFWNMAMPLIRYDIGDLVVPRSGVCDCGRCFPMVERIIGREGTYIRTPSGRVLGAMAIEYILARVLYAMYKMPILEGQIVQEREDLVTLEYVALDAFTPDDGAKLLTLLRQEIPSEMQVRLRQIDKMKQTSSGKYLSFAQYEHH